MARTKSRTILPDYEVSSFEGLNTAVKDVQTLQKGTTPDAVNWVTSRFKDSISLRRGSAVLGATVNTGSGRITGLGVGIRYDGKQVPFFSYLRKLKYYSDSLIDTVEIGSDILPAKASGEDVSFAATASIAGSFAYVSSPNSSMYKIPVANPGSAVDLLATEYKGLIQSAKNRLVLWNRKGSTGQDLTAVYFSKLDKHLFVSDYPHITAEVVGALGSTTYSGTLAFKAGGTKRTCFQVVITEASNEVMTDDKNGNLVGSLGSTGTINYATGAYSVTFNHTTTGAVTADYYWEDSSISTPSSQTFAITGVSQAASAVVTVASHAFYPGDVVYITGVVGMTQLNGNSYTVTAVTATTITLNVNSTSFTAWSSGGTIQKNNASGGIADFSFNTPNRYAGDGNILRQDDLGGILNAVVPFIGVQYGIHARKIWATTISDDDLTYSNRDYRVGCGILYWRSAQTSDQGILLIDTSNPSQPVIRRLELQQNTIDTTIVPVSKSDALDLSSNSWDQGVAFRWGDYEMFACKGMTNGSVDSANNYIYVRNIYTGVWDRLKFPASCFADYMGSLLVGDSTSNNVFTLFSGYDENGDTIENYWKSSDMNVGSEGIKTVNRLVVQGLIQRDQQLQVYTSTDGGNFVLQYTILGSADYVNTNPISIGNNTIGSTVIGGGTTNVAYAYEVEFPIALQRFENVTIKFVATSIGFCQVNKFRFKDIRYKGRKGLPSNIE